MNKRKEIVLICSVIKTDESLSATLGIDFAPMLNEALELGFSDVVLMQDTGGLYARDVCSHDGLKMEGAKVVRTAKQEAHSTFLLNIELSDLVKLPYVALSLDSIDSRLSRLAAQALTDGMSILEKRNNAINSEEIVPMYYPDILYLSNYPIVDQNVNGVQRGLCWAATVASMCRFELPGKWSSLTAKQVADQMNIGYDAGGQSKDIINALTSYLGSPYSPQDRPVLSEYDIKVVINNNDPAYMRCTLKTGFWPWNKDRHGVALAGYNYFSSSPTVRIMDPAYEAFKVCTRNASGQWTFAFGDASFTWARVIRLFYI